MSAIKNAFAKMPAQSQITAEASAFIEAVQFEQISEEALRIGTRCLLDGLGLYVAGSGKSAVQILIDEARCGRQGRRPSARDILARTCPYGSACPGNSGACARLG